MDLYPAIDLRGGHAVRLLQGDYARETVYDDDPAARAAAFAAAGAPWIHVVDLDAARSGEAGNLDAIAAICQVAAEADVRIEVGGGVRTPDAARRLWELGADRVVVGTAAVENPELVDALAAEAPGRVAVGLDARAGEVAVHGWTEGSGRSLDDLVARFDRPGVGALVVTSIQRDGTMEGPDLDQLRSVLERCAADVVASGGVGTAADIAALAALRVGDRRLAGVIVGRAIYEGRVGVEEALVAATSTAGEEG